MIMAHIGVYLNLDGKCREAMTFYQAVLGGELFLQTVAESPLAEHMPAEMGNAILHSKLTKGDLVLMASDMTRGPAIFGNTVQLNLNCTSEDEIKACFENLAIGGQVTDPLGEMFWGDLFGTLTDQFGIHWMLNYAKSQAG